MLKVGQKGNSYLCCPGVQSYQTICNRGFVTKNLKFRIRHILHYISVQRAFGIATYLGVPILLIFTFLLALIGT